MSVLIDRLAHSRPALILVAAGIIALFVTLGITISNTASEGPDEVAHFFFNRFIARYGRLPLDGAERAEAGYKADLPPLFYLVVGEVGYLLGLDSAPHLKTNRDNLRLALVTGHENIKAWRVIRTEDPLRGEILLWQLGRWLSLAFGVLGLILVFVLLRVCIPGRPWLAVSGMAVIGMMPAYVYVSSVTSYESLVGVLMTAYFVVVALIVNPPRPGNGVPLVAKARRTSLYFVAGLLVGLAAVDRHTPWPVLPLLPLLILWLAFRQSEPWKLAARYLLLFGLGVLLTFGWWVLYIFIFFNKIDRLGLVSGLLSPLLIGDGSGHTSQQIASVMTNGQIGLSDVPRGSDSLALWAWTFFSGMWGHGWLGWLMLLVWGVALVGLVRRWRRDPLPLRLWFVVLIAHVAAILVFPLLRFIFSGSANTAMTQHILFPAGAAILLLLIYGLAAFPRLSGIVPVFLFGLAAIYAGQNLSHFASDELTVFPIRTLPLPAEEPALAQFDELTLLRASTGPAGRQALQTTLWWRTEKSPVEDYQVELTLFDSRDNPRSQWIGQPLNGRYPTRAWLPGDRVRQSVLLPVAGLPAGNYRLRLRLLKSPEVADSLDLAEVALLPASLAAGHRLQFDDQAIQFRLWLPPSQPSPDGLPLFGENATITVSTAAPVNPEQIRLVLAGPTGQTYPPVVQVDRTLLYRVSPRMASGVYRLQAETAGAAVDDSLPLLSIETEDRIFSPEETVANPLAANFAGYLSLLGYNLPDNSVEAGTAIPVEYFWQAQQTIGADLVQFNHLIGPDGRQWAGRDRRAREVYSTLFWAPGEVVSDQYKLEIPADTPPGTYYLLVGWYLPVGESSVSLPLMQAGQMSDETHVTIGPLEVMANHAN